MSIAVNAVVQPSRRLRLALTAYALANALAAIALAVGTPERFHSPWLLAGACLLAALAAGHAALHRPTAHGIDISGLGEIRLTVQQWVSAPLQLMPGSTLWPSLLLLLLRDPERGVLTVLPVLSDSLPHEQFRKLGVAIRAIAGRDNKFSEKHKIH